MVLVPGGGLPAADDGRLSLSVESSTAGAATRTSWGRWKAAQAAQAAQAGSGSRTAAGRVRLTALWDAWCEVGGVMLRLARVRVLWPLEVASAEVPLHHVGLGLFLWGKRDDRWEQEG
jgi:hypothetical protein